MKWDTPATGLCYDVIILEDNISPMKKSADAPIDTDKEAGVEVNAEETKYIVM
jgi:hypothetical protein